MIVKNDIEAQYEWVKRLPQFEKLNSVIPFVPGQTYAGPGGWGDRLVPDTMYGLFVGHCCWPHDCRFEIGGNEEDFQYANDMMYLDLKNWIRSRDHWRRGWNWALRPLALRRARKYYLAVCLGGRLSFNFNKAKKITGNK